MRETNDSERDSGPGRVTEELTQLVTELAKGGRGQLEQYLPALYRELRQLAQSKLRGERAGHTLSPTALVHEVYLRLLGEKHRDVESRAHFFALAARAMRQVLIDHARHRRRHKRGGGQVVVTLTAALGVPDSAGVDLLELDDALRRLAEKDPRKAEVVELLYFGGLSAREAGELLGVSERTVERDWRVARLLLLRDVFGEA